MIAARPVPSSRRRAAVCRPFWAAAFTVLLLALIPGSADAKMLKAMWGPVSVNGQSQFPVYKDLGVDILELSVRWNQIAPTRPAHPADPNDPAYTWPAEIDEAIRQAKATHMTILIGLLGTPAWANGNHDPIWTPTNPKDFATFAQAAAKRWPAVARWMIWVEPTRHQTYMPLRPEAKRNTPLAADQRATGHRYASLLDATYGALKKVQPRDLVIGGNSYTAGDISPKNWIRNLRLPNGRVPRMDYYGHNPFTGRRPDLAKPPLGSGFADISDLDTLLGWLDGYGLRNARGRKLQLFISEFTIPTDKNNHEFDFFVDRPTQADWLTAAFGVARQTKRVAAFGWINLIDEAPRPDGLEVHNGLMTTGGVKKPGYFAYKRART